MPNRLAGQSLPHARRRRLAAPRTKRGSAAELRAISVPCRAMSRNREIVLALDSRLRLQKRIRLKSSKKKCLPRPLCFSAGSFRREFLRDGARQMLPSQK